MVTCLLLARILRALPSPSLSCAFDHLQGGCAVFSHKWVEGLVTKPTFVAIFVPKIRKYRTISGYFTIDETAETGIFQSLQSAPPGFGYRSLLQN